MRVFNVRLGHACNSSSSHSIVPLASLGGSAHDSYHGGEFGWDHFTLASPGAKMQYLAAQLSGRLPAMDITEITGIEGYGDDDFGYVDHQSVMDLPTQGPSHREFLEDLATYLKRDDVVILGGNDNGGRTTVSHLPTGKDYWPSPSWMARSGKTPSGEKYWTIMDPRTGDRIRFSFEGQPLSGDGDGPDPEHDDVRIKPVVADPLELPYADTPELVDLKVTNYCPFEKDCPWCYMASTKEGAHGSTERAIEWLEAFRDAGLFEVAIGGGEPTLWPGLPTFLERADAFGINVNLTTKNIAWLKDIPELVRAVAVSINNERDLNRLQETPLGRRRPVYDRPEITAQCVPAFCEPELLERLIKYACKQEMRITFLGVKRVGRAAAEQRMDDLVWLELLMPYREEHRWWLMRNIAVDTLMAANAEPEFQRLGVDPVWYETTEGKFSCYVDATTDRLGQCSYTDLLLPSTPSEFVDSFQEMQRKAGIRP